MSRNWMTKMAALGIAAMGATAQQADPHAAHKSQAITKAEVIADGATDPDKIPDELCVRFLLITLAADAGDSQAFAAKTARIELGDGDLQALNRAVAEFRPVMAAHQTALKAIRPLSPAQAASAAQAAFGHDQKLNATVSEQYRTMLASMSPAGQAKLASHLARMKARIRIVGAPAM